MPDNPLTFLNWFAALADITAGICLAIPALRFSRDLLQLESIKEPQQSQESELERLRTKYVSSMSRLLSAWDNRDHRLLWIGFSAFVLGGVAKLAGLWVASI